MKVTTKQAMLDLANVFLCKTLTKKVWKQKEIVELFYKSMYEIALYYVANEEEKKEINERENERMMKL